MCVYVCRHPHAIANTHVDIRRHPQFSILRFHLVWDCVSHHSLLCIWGQLAHDLLVISLTLTPTLLLQLSGRYVPPYPALCGFRGSSLDPHTWVERSLPTQLFSQPWFWYLFHYLISLNAHNSPSWEGWNLQPRDSTRGLMHLLLFALLSFPLNSIRGKCIYPEVS